MSKAGLPPLKSVRRCRAPARSGLLRKGLRRTAGLPASALNIKSRPNGLWDLSTSTPTLAAVPRTVRPVPSVLGRLPARLQCTRQRSRPRACWAGSTTRLAGKAGALRRRAAARGFALLHEPDDLAHQLAFQQRRVALIGDFDYVSV